MEKNKKMKKNKNKHLISILFFSDDREMLHNASLLIEDSFTLRRGFPVAHSIYGGPSVINSANYVYFLGLEKVLTHDHPEAVRVFTRQLVELHHGREAGVLTSTGEIPTYPCPTESQYSTMVLQKTGGLFGPAVGLMQLFSGWEQDLKVDACYDVQFYSSSLLISMSLSIFKHKQM
uniref:Uncharacterized protein n=1 Tax=Oncorhynchus kisutch TaxID=8019 RepID=A0A8C7K088_ONCKI